MGKDSKEKKDDLIQTARARFKVGIESDAHNRAEAAEDMKFRAGDQWPEEVKNQRALESRPCLTINKIPQNIHQITNDQRQNRPMIKVSPYDDGADPETARVLQGIIRNIEVNSNADTAYDCAFDSAVTGGRGFVRVITDYCDPRSFNQDIKILTVDDPNRVVIDPNYKEPDGSDADWCFIFEDISKDEFERKYPDAEVSSTGFDYSNLGSDWFLEDKVRIAEYFVKSFEDDILVQLPDGSTALKSEIEDAEDSLLLEMGLTPEILEALYSDKDKSRKTQIPVVNWYKINGEEILEKTKWAGTYIPVIPVHGETLIIEGKRIFEGIVRHARDAQRMYNYWATAETEAIALAPKAPFIGAEGQFKGHENQWKTANTKNHPYLQYKPVALNGTPVAPPQRVNSEANVGAINQARMLAADDLKSTTGIYDASLGNRSNESSGIAINRRNQQAQTGNFHFVDNLSRSIRHLGTVLIELIPIVYDTERVVRIIGPDEKEEIVAINTIFKDKDKLTNYSFETGKYDVSVSTGPSYASKRQESLDALLKLVQSYPAATQFAGDLILKNMDFQGADEIAERLLRSIPPEIVGNDEEIPPQVQAQIQQLTAQLDTLSKALEEKDAELNDKKIELESKERIEFAKLETKAEIELAKLNAKNPGEDELLLSLSNQISELEGRLSNLSYQDPFNEEIPQKGNLTSEMPLGTPPEMGEE